MNLEMEERVQESCLAPGIIAESKSAEALENEDILTEPEQSRTIVSEETSKGEELTSIPIPAVSKSEESKEAEGGVLQNVEESVAPELSQKSDPQIASNKDESKDLGVSDGSPASQISDVADESALQNLNVDYSDSDSALGDMTPQTSVMSLQSSIYHYVEENGRTYHRYKEGAYMLPNDEDEMDRLDLQHQLWVLTLHQELFLAPVKTLNDVLDIGTGTGIWAIELANKHPTAHVIGSDLSPIQPQYVPSNCQFEVDDAEDEWNYHRKFDLIHGRAMATCFKDPAAVIRSAVANLNPGGYLEFHDFVLPMHDIDGTLQGTAFDNWQSQTMAAAANLGLTWKKSRFWARYFEEAGLVDVQERHFQWPMNRWPKGEHLKMLGSYWQEDLLRGLEGLSMAALTRGGGLTKEEVVALAAEARKDVPNRKIHAYLPVLVVFGRKPETEIDTTTPVASDQ